MVGGSGGRCDGVAAVPIAVVVEESAAVITIGNLICRRVYVLCCLDSRVIFRLQQVSSFRFRCHINSLFHQSTLLVDYGFFSAKSV